MSSKRELRSAGSTAGQTLDATKLYKLNSAGAVVEATSVAGTDIVFSGSKSSLRRLNDLERNVSILAAKAFTDDGTGSGDSGDIDYAKTAGAWKTARTLSLTGDVTGSVSIDGSGNASLSTTIAANSVALGTDTTGNYMVNVSAGTGISVSHTQGEGSTATISSTITQYTDALARGAVSAGTGLSYNSTTGVFTNSITQYTDALARAAISASGGGLSYNSTTGALSLSYPSTSNVSEGSNLYYTDARARAAHSFTAGSGGYNSTTGVITIPTNTNQLTNGAGFITGYTETSTLANVTARGATTTAALSTGALTVTGAITATGEVTAYYSDKNLKKDIVEIEDPIAKVMSLRGVTFRPNETAIGLGIIDKEEVGVIAQEVEAVLPQLVTPSAFAGYKTVKYDKLTALLLEAVKAQQLQIDALRAEISKLGGSAKNEL